ncbi:MULTISPECIES: glycosyltransferase family 2 protein [unclassified Bacillus cereus group]|uniref:glycosyltransferase family 2 protein n=1 Tax=unclassified Bacillus cereus group TaxID=2750818 RepID=UPI001F5648FD|nr:MULTISPECIES: glycosyltransferase family 2 protein [unclassified Bacillus cereus group]
MKKPLISVILPIYNVEKYIVECLESLVNQTIGVENLEVIMVNDCSTDGTGAILDQYALKYDNFKVIHLEKNCGAPGKPRNIGIDLAKGKYLIFMDPDDYIPADAYETLFNVAEEYKSDFVMGKMRSFNDSDGVQGEHTTFRHYLLQKYYYNVDIKRVPFFMQVKTAIILKLVRTSFVRKNKIYFIEGMRNGEDKYYDAQLFTKAKQFSYIPQVVYMYRSRNDEGNLSLTQQNIMSTVVNDVKSFQMIKTTLDKEQYNYFQVNVLRSILWKVCDPDFNRLRMNEKKELMNLIREVIKDYDKNIVKKYLLWEEPLLSLIAKGCIEEAIDYNGMLISRRWWYKKGTELQKKYKKQMAIRDSFSWKITKPLRNRNFKIVNVIKGRFLNEDKRSGTAIH